MGEKQDVWQGTLALMILKTLETLGPLHGYGIARRIEQTSGDRLCLNYGTLYPALLKLEQEGSIAFDWGVSDNNRRAKFYKLTRAGRRQARARDPRMGAHDRGPRAVPGAGRGRLVRPLRVFFARLAGLFGRARQERDLADELASHIQMHVDDAVRAGMTPDAARREAIAAARRDRSDPGARSRPAEGAVSRNRPARPALRGAIAAPEPRVRGRHDLDARARHRREHGDLHDRPRACMLRPLPFHEPDRIIGRLGGEREAARPPERRLARQFPALAGAGDRVRIDVGVLRLPRGPDRPGRAGRARRPGRDVRTSSRRSDRRRFSAGRSRRTRVPTATIPSRS